MEARRLTVPQPRFLFFGGKGGVGKTTCAAARALSEARGGRRVLAVSTDPAHSLGDALAVRLGARPRRVSRRLDAVELDAPRAFTRWLARHRSALGDVLEHGTWLDRGDVNALLDLTIPGVDELAGLLEIARLARLRDVYDTVVVDTAPTGHTLRLLAAPDTVAAVAEVLDAMQHSHRIVRERFGGAAAPEAADRLIELVAREAAEMSSTLRDAARTGFHWVTLPETLALAETTDGIQALVRGGMHLREIVVNRLLPDGAPCGLCDPRRAEQRRVVAKFAKSSARRAAGARCSIVVVFDQVVEPRGVRALTRVVATPLTAVSLAVVRRAARSVAPLPRRGFRIDPATWPPVRGARLLFVGGKGGVGKTTIAAAIALRIARAHAHDSVLLLSTDPAHSVADVLDAPLCDEPRPIPGGPPNLAARELDAVAAFQAKREAIQQAIDSVATSTAPVAVGSGDAVSRLLELAPPGIDELFGMLSILDARAAHRVIVVDTAPTGHALRLLETPEAAREWVRLLLEMLLKYKSVVRPGALGAELVAVSKSIRELQNVLHDPDLARFIVVTRAAAVPRAETERLLRRLQELRLAVPALVVNARTIAPGRCARCGAAARAERRELAALKPPRGCDIIQTPLVAPPPRGAVALERWAETWVPGR